jgi:uncharacterized protein YprB with RNaseH-like and TPR domain
MKEPLFKGSRRTFFVLAIHAKLANKRRMSDLQEQLAALRQRVAKVLEDCAEKYEKPGFTGVSSTSSGSAPAREARRFHVEDWLPGREIETELGKHFESETFYARHRVHGSAEISSLADLPHNLLEIISDGAISGVPPQQWAFLDTETTGLSGGTGTCAFLIGVGQITAEGFLVRQFFMRDYGEESSTLHALSEHLKQFKVMITYNGRTFDQPLLETRYRLNRARPPFPNLEHLDLLYSARRLWKLRFESCRLIELENQILGVERQGDVPGALIPYIYFEYVRSGEMSRLLPVFHHNAIDILSLACLTGIVPHAFRDPVNAHYRSGSEAAGIARWLREAGELDQARSLFRRAVDQGLPDPLLFRTLWDIAAIEKKLGADEAALSLWSDLAACRNAFQVPAYEELAKHHEHRTRNYALALALTQEALELDLLKIGEKIERFESLRRREQRLKRRVESGRLAGPRSSKSTTKPGAKTNARIRKPSAKNPGLVANPVD